MSKASGREGVQPRPSTGLKKAALSLCAVSAALVLWSCLSIRPAGESRGGRPLVFACRADNDLYAALARAEGAAPPRFENPLEALTAAAPGGAALILADAYPEKTTALSAEVFALAARKSLRLYVEFPSFLPGLEVGSPRGPSWERAVVSSDAFGAKLKNLRILGIHGCRFVPARASAAHIVMARVAGFDEAIYGLPKETFPILFELPGLPSGAVLAASTKLSQFITARYAPAEAWTAIWEMILGWLRPEKPAFRLRWTPAVRPSYAAGEILPPDGELRALRRGLAWFFNARMLLGPQSAEIYEGAAKSWPDRVGPAPRPQWPSGDGSLGVLEGFNAVIHPDGSQGARWWRRHDCTGESAGAMALAGLALGDDHLRHTGANLADFLYERSIMARGERLDPKHPAYGLIGWNDVPRYYGDMDGFGVYYGDDNARGMLGMMAAAAGAGSDRWNERLALALLANLRLTGRRGFQPDRIDEAPLEASGWLSLFRSDAVSISPHFQSYLWACHLWAYARSGFPLFLERAKAAIRTTMEAYPDRWVWTNGIQQERSRMLLPLAWLVRVEDTSEHRQWLRFMAGEVQSGQDASGAIREELGRGASGYAPPATNEAYGTTEASLIQRNGDPVADLLYTSNFAFLGLHEAAAATGEPIYREMEDKLAAFLCRAQVRSEAHPEFDGAWFRAFEFKRWDYWASSADAGWGAWSIETGWTQTWITAVLALRRLNTSLWEMTRDVGVREPILKLRPSLIPDAVLAGGR